MLNKKFKDIIKDNAPYLKDWKQNNKIYTMKVLGAVWTSENSFGANQYNLPIQLLDSGLNYIISLSPFQYKQLIRECDSHEIDLEEDAFNFRGIRTYDENGRQKIIIDVEGA